MTSRKPAKRDAPPDAVTTKPTLLLVPGLGSGVWVYDEISRWLAEEANLVPVAIPGMAGSPSAEGSIVEAAVARITECAARQLAPLFLVGHSLGGALVLAAASRIRNLAGIVIIDAGPRFVPSAERPAAEAEIAGDADELAPLHDTAGRETNLRRWIEEMVLSSKHRDRIWQDFLATEPAKFRELLIAGRALQLRIDPVEIKVPVLVLAACESNADIADTMSDFEKRYKGPKQVSIVPIEPARHFLMLDQPEQTAEQIFTFVENVTTGALKWLPDERNTSGHAQLK